MLAPQQEWATQLDVDAGSHDDSLTPPLDPHPLLSCNYWWVHGIFGIDGLIGVQVGNSGIYSTGTESDGIEPSFKYCLSLHMGFARIMFRAFGHQQDNKWDWRVSCVKVQLKQCIRVVLTSDKSVDSLCEHTGRVLDAWNVLCNVLSLLTLVLSALGSLALSTSKHMQNNHGPLPAHPLLTTPLPTNKTSVVEDFILSKALTTLLVKKLTLLVKLLLSPQKWMAESVHIFQPLIYGQIASPHFCL